MSTAATAIFDSLAELKIPLGYMDEYYNLRLHIALVLDRLRKQLGVDNRQMYSSTPVQTDSAPPLAAAG